MINRYRQTSSGTCELEHLKIFFLLLLEHPIFSFRGTSYQVQNNELTVQPHTIVPQTTCKILPPVRQLIL